MIASLIAAAYTFTASATGVEKGTPLEFMFAGKDTDRDYETMFVLDEPIETFCRELEKAGLPRGKPVDERNCYLWPVGCKLTIDPPLADFVRTEMPEGLSLGSLIYTGGTRSSKGEPEAGTTMPLSALCLYTLAQSPIVFNGYYPQGEVYNCHKASVSLKKGERRKFTLSWDGHLPKHVDILLEPGNAKSKLIELKEMSSQHDELDVLVDFSDQLTLSEATLFAQALSVLDSVKVKINGRRKGHLFYRSFLPLVKWKDRKERLTQPFEVSIDANGIVKYVHLEEDWSGESLDPVLTEKIIKESDLSQYPKTDTVFFYAKGDAKLKVIYDILGKFSDSVLNHYVYVE